MSSDSFVTESYKDTKHNRHWWWRMKDADHDPLFYHLLSSDEIHLLSEWYRDTDEKKLIGECAPPMISFITGLIAGNAIKRVVQLGHYAGYSTLLVGTILRKITNGRLATIDISEPMSNYTQSWVDRFSLSNNVKVITSDSAAPLAMKEAIKFLDGNPEIVIIDSAHSYDHTVKELDLWYPNLKQNGFIFLHDASRVARSYDPKKGAVAGALDDWCSENDLSYFVLNGGDVTPAKSHDELVYRDGRGLGIIQKRSET